MPVLLLRSWLVFVIALVLVFFCFFQPGHRSLGNRLLVAFSRLVMCWVILLPVLLFGPSMMHRAQVEVRAAYTYASSLVVASLPLHSVASPSPSIQSAPRSSPVVVSSSLPETSVLGGPSLSVAFMDQVLSRYHSPAAGSGWALYSLSQRYGIDDAFALAFFWHESNFGINGEAAATHSLGNLRCIASAPCVDQDRGGYASFPDWPAGFAAWYALIAGPVYVGDGRSTVETIIPRYAPTADRNDEQAYIANVVSVVARLRAGDVAFA